MWYCMLYTVRLCFLYLDGCIHKEACPAQWKPHQGDTHQTPCQHPPQHQIWQLSGIGRQENTESSTGIDFSCYMNLDNSLLRLLVTSTESSWESLNFMRNRLIMSWLHWDESISNQILGLLSLSHLLFITLLFLSWHFPSLFCCSEA